MREKIKTTGISLSPYGIEDIVKFVPDLKDKMNLLVEKVKAEKEFEESKSEDDKFALGIIDLSVEDRVFIKLRLKGVKDGVVGWTSRGIQMGVFINQFKNNAKRKTELRQRKNVIKLKRKKERSKKKKLK